MVMSTVLREGPASRRGVEYQVANGEGIPNLGEKRFSAWTEENMSRNILNFAQPHHEITTRPRDRPATRLSQ